MGRFSDLFTEADNKTLCPIRVFGAPPAVGITLGALWVFLHDPNGTHFIHVCTGVGGFLMTWSGAITGKSRLGGDATQNGGQNAASSSPSN